MRRCQNIIKILIVLVFSIYNVAFCNTYTRIDSLRRIVEKNSKANIKKLEANHMLSKEYLEIDADSAMIFGQNALSIAQSLNDTVKIINSLLFLGEINTDLEHYETSVKYYTESLELAKKHGDKKLIAIITSNVGNAYFDWTHYNNAKEFYTKSLELFKEINNNEGIVICLEELGSVCMTLEDYESAIEYFSKALNIVTESTDLSKMIDLSHKLGIINSLSTNHDDALINYRKALKHSQAIDDKANITNAHFNIGLSYEELEENHKAVQHFNKALEVLKEIDDPEFECKVLHGIGHSYLFMGECYTAIEYLLKSLNKAKELDNNRMIIFNYNAFSHAYMGIKNPKEAKEYYKKYVKLKEKEDKISYDEKTKLITHAKEKEIERLNHEWEKDEALLAKQRMVIYTFIAGLVVILAFAFLIFTMYRQKRKANTVLVTQRDEIQRNQNEIMDSIKYAKQIQEAILPSSDIVKKLLKEHFIFYKPKDIVSGDFYWMSKIKNHVVIAVADCTGHGVPGAFMSVLGVSLLNEIVNKTMIVDPGKILDLLREELIKALKQKGNLGEHQDGMDIAVCTINYNTNKLQYAGANNSLYFIKDSELTEIKADKMPIGIYPKIYNFKVTNIDIAKGDCFYMFSDGYADQFGGENGKKFKYKAFKQLLLQSQGEPMSKQISVLSNTLNNWMSYNDPYTNKKYEQVDDIVVLGIKI